MHVPRAHEVKNQRVIAKRTSFQVLSLKSNHLFAHQNTVSTFCV